MILLRRLLAVASAFAVVIASPVIAATKWLRADTHNFIIYSSGNAQQLREFAENVERFDALLRLRTNVARDEQPYRLTIYMLAQADDVARMVEDKQEMTAGIYLPRAEGSFAIANRSKANSKFDLSGNTVLFHEYAHHFMFRNFTAPYPSWYIEGFAEFVSTATFKSNGEWQMGAPPYYCGNSLVSVDVPIESLLFEVARRKTGAQTDAFYGRSWLLVHMLSMDPAWSGKLTGFLKATMAGTPHRDAAIAAFGDLALLDKALDKYLARRNVTAVSSKRPVEVDGAITIGELDQVASRLVELGLKRRTASDVTKTRDALKLLAVAAPGNANVWYELALAEQQMGKDLKDEPLKATVAATEAAVDRALALDPNHGRANVLKARLTFDRLSDARDDSAPSWRAARAFVTKANAADNLDPEPLAAWYESFVRQGRTPSKTASDGLALAYSRAPEALGLRMNYAFDLARRGEYDAAIKLVEVLAYDPHNGEAGAAVLVQLKAMRDHKDGPGASAADQESDLP